MPRAFQVLFTLLLMIQGIRCAREGRGWLGTGFGFEKFGAAAIALAELLIDESTLHRVHAKSMIAESRKIYELPEESSREAEVM
jgi:hypothetical protein